MEFNIYLSDVEELKLDTYPKEIQDLFWDFINNVPYINYMVSNARERAKDIPKDSKGRIIVDVTKPHILEDMDYFRPAAKFYQKNGCYTFLRPNPNPNSEYHKWISEEIRRCWYGYVRESDGEWVTGDMYFFLNYCPIPLTKMGKNKKGERVIDFPEFWEGIYYRFHYMELALNGGIFNEIGGLHGSEISSRGKSKSLSMAAKMAKYFILGENLNVNRFVKCMATSYLKLYLTSDGILNKFLSYIDFLAINMPLLPNKRLKSSMQDMLWTMGYLDLDTGAKRGTLNEVIGVSVKDDPSKVRGKRLNFIIVEEFGSFKNVLELYNIMIPSVLEGTVSFGQIYLIGTAGDDESDFQGALEIIYNPKGYNMYGLPNVFDKEGLGRKDITFFFAGYINRKGCYDENGNSDVTKAILEILADRYRVKYNSTDINSITKTIAEIPITPQEALLRSSGNMFPVTELNERINLIDSMINAYDDVYIGTLVLNPKTGKVEFTPTTDVPIRHFPTKDNKVKGAIEIFNLPEKDNNGEVFNNRYILGHDPVDDDSANTMSLTSTFVLDLWTDRIVAEYTGRLDYADLNFEIVRLLCLFYNGKCMYELNKKGIFAYFSQRNCTYLLADTPQYLKDLSIIKDIGYGNKAKGIVATLPLNNYANQLIKEWLIKPVPTIILENNEEKEIMVSNLFFIRNRALLQELVLFNPNINVDRVRALGMLMLYRQEKIVLYLGDIKGKQSREIKTLADDPFFTKNYTLNNRRATY